MQTMIMALANQKDQFGESIIINPATIVVPSGMKFDMYTLFFSPTINTSDNTQAVNPLYQYRDSIEVVEQKYSPPLHHDGWASGHLSPDSAANIDQGYQ